MIGRELVKDLIEKEVREGAETIWGKNAPGRGSSEYKGPEAGSIPKFLNKNKVAVMTVQ